MIKLNRPEEVEFSINNKSNWKLNLIKAVNKYGGYSKIPEVEKKSLVKFCGDEKIKSVLSVSSNHKCAYCECSLLEGGYSQVEHFYPKSLYPEEAFDWDNYLAICTLCNGEKLNHDTKKELIVNPYDEDPNNYFYYESINIKAIDENEIAKNTIKVVGLETGRLWRPRAEILISLNEYSRNLKEALYDFHENSDTDVKKINRIKKIKASLYIIDDMKDPRNKYSAFSKSYLEKCEFYIEAKNIIADYEEIDF